MSDDVRAAHDGFYAALNALLAGDLEAMDDVWARTDDVSTMHPLGGRQLGWEEVRASFQGAAAAFDRAEVRPEELEVRVIGDAAYTLCVERGSGSAGGQTLEFEARATNVYRREDGAWKMVHHHADVAPPLQQLAGPPPG